MATPGHPADHLTPTDTSFAGRPAWRPEPDADGVGSIAVYVCTHERNGPLRRMLASLDVAASRVQPGVEVAVVVVDDNPDGRAEAVVEDFEHSFARGLHYRHSGAQNISKARNLGLTTAMDLADWVGMTDDDQVVVPEWLEAMVDLQRATGADAVTGPVKLRYPDEASTWLKGPFEEILEAPPHPDGTRVETCSTGNSMLRTSFLAANPDIRFRDDLGRLGGEDMVFYKAAIAAGLDARYSNAAFCWGEQPPERSTYRWQLRSSLWMGNTKFVTNYEAGEATRFRLLLRGGRKLVEAVGRPVLLLVRGRNPEFHYAGALVAQAVGMLVGVIGIRIAHK